MGRKPLAAGFVALVLGAVMQAPGLAAPNNPLRITAPVNITQRDLAPARTYGSPFLVVDPNNPMNIVAATVEMRSRACLVFRSNDGGQTWRQMDNLPAAPGYPFCFQTSGSVTESPMAWGRNGTLYLAMVGWDVQDGGDARGNLSTVVARSTNLGTTWQTTIVRNNRGKTGADVETDRPVSGIAVDSKTGSQDIVYVSYRRNLSSATPTPPSRPMVQVSMDGGRTFGDPVDVEDAWAKNPNNITGTFPPDKKTPANVAGFNPIMAVDAKGNAYVLWERRSQGVTPSTNFAYYVSKSIDHGKTWTVTEAFPETQNLAGGFMVWSPQGGPDGTLHLVWHAKPGGTQGDTDIYYKQSTDGAKTFSAPKLLNDDDPSKLATQLLPSIGVAPNGRVDIAWWDFRDDPGNYVNDVYYTYSLDNGKTFAKNIRITDRSINRKIGPWSNGFDMRQPVGIASTDKFTVFAWDDTRNGNTDTQSQDMYSSIVQFQALGGGASNAVKYVLSALVGVAVVGLVLLIAALARRDRGSPQKRAARRPESAQVR
jgi:hypothetical protein